MGEPFADGGAHVSVTCESPTASTFGRGGASGRALTFSVSEPDTWRSMRSVAFWIV